MTCANCGVDLPANAKFCLECGASVVAQPAADEYRRTVTLVFTDVTGSTALGEQLDPEAYRSIMGRYFEVARTAIEAHGGTVEKFVGDAVLAVFGVPDVREDDALRAVRAAQDLQRAVCDLSDELGQEIGARLEVRTGVNTGPVVVGAARAGGSFATGDAVNTAARLEQAAQPGTVLIGRATYDLVRDAVVVEEVAPVTARGKAEPVPAYRLLGVQDTTVGRARHLDAALVGRERESRALDEALERALDLDRGHLVTVLGGPGLGKTRLVDDFLSRIGDRALVASGRCVAYGAGITYWPVVQVLRQVIGLNGEESPDHTRRLVEDALEGCPSASAVVELVLPLLGPGGEPGETDRTLWAVGRLLEHVATTRPLVIRVDDLHWAEPTLLALLDRVRDEIADLPVLMVCGARPELMERHPGWGAGAMNATLLGLEPFTSEQTRQSLTTLLPGHHPGDLVEAVAHWSGGNPLFVEEVVTHLCESGLLSEEAGAWRLSPGVLTSHGGVPAHDLVPPTVAALLAARLDRLPEAERRLLERIAVVGLEVAADEAAVLADGELESTSALLTSLGRRDLLRRVRGSSGDRWQFRHVMVREAAYDALPKTVRATLHERFAGHVEASVAHDSGVERLAFVAHHLEQAARHQWELTPGASAATALTLRAATALVDAGRAAHERDDLPATESLLRRVLDLPLADRSVRRDAMARLTSVVLERGRRAEGLVLLDAYEAELDDTATDLDRAYVRGWRLTRALRSPSPADPVEVSGAGDRLADLARAADDPLRRRHGLIIKSQGVAAVGHWDELLDVARELEQVGGLHARRRAASLTLEGLLWGSSAMRDVAAFAAERMDSPGQSEDRRAVYRVCLAAAAAAASKTSDSRSVVDAAAEACASVEGYGLDLAVVLELGYEFLGCHREALLSVTRRLGADPDPRDLVLVAVLQLELNDPPADVRQSLDRAAAAASPHDVTATGALAGVSCLLAAREGRHDAASLAAENALAGVDASQETTRRADVRRWLAEAARLRSDPAAERQLLEEATRLYREKEVAFWARVCDERLAELTVG